jgi:predicted DCC family thiol-disulfide oxidoreductase YuxK
MQNWRRWRNENPWEAHNFAQHSVTRAKNANVAASDKQRLLSHAIVAINISERLKMFWRKIGA